MKKLFAILMALIVCGTESVFAQPRLGPLCGYTPPRSEFRDLKLSANYRYYNDQFADNRDNVNSGSMRASFSRVLDAPNFGLSQHATLKLDLTKDAFTYQADGTLNLRAYIAQTNFFGFIGVETQGATTFVSPGLRISAGLGYGRFKDVTALSKALKIQERLLEMKAISSSLPADVILELADTIGRRAEFPDLASLVQRLEEIIEATGFVLQEQLGAVELLRIEEILSETADEKLCGWELRLGMGYELLDPQGGMRDWLTLGAFEYALAPAPRSQFRSSLRFSSSLSLLEDYVLIAQALYSFRITESIDAQASYNFVRTQLKDRAPLDMQSLEVRLTFQVQANLNLAVQVEFTLASDFEEWTQGLTITANYDLF